MGTDECTGWLIVFDNNRSLLGAPEYFDGKLVALEPVWDLQAQRTLSPVMTPMGPRMNAAGEMQMQERIEWYVASPLFLYSITRLQVRPDAAVVKLDELTAQERRRIVNALHAAQDKAKEMSANDAGILPSRIVGVKG